MNMKSIFLAATVLLGGLPIASVLAADEEKTPEKMFQSLDSNADGYITMDEAQANDDLVTSFEDGDNDDDGRLTLAEFSKMELVDE